MILIDTPSGERVIAQASDILAEAAKIYAAAFQGGEKITSPEIAIPFIQAKLSLYEHEVFACLFLTNAHAVIRFEELFRGTIDSASVYPREVVKTALRLNASAIICAHNHPSGNTEPSSADMEITNRLKAALALVDIRILDHFIVGDGVTSFAQRGLL